MQNAWAGKALVYHRHTQIPGIINLSKKKKRQDLCWLMVKDSVTKLGVSIDLGISQLC